jgi:DNA-binding CsgD family transcriptional regulator
VTLLRRRIAETADGHVGAAPALALLVRARLAQDDVDGARAAADRLARLAGGGTSAYTEALAATALAVSAAPHETAERGERLEVALKLFTRLGMPHDAARVRLDLARALAASRPDEAVVEADTALATFDRIGARADADAAAALLRSLGAAPRPARRGSGELTDRERQVLRLVGLGLTNPEIAARLHISRKTAAHHVSSVLNKLGVRNRTEAVAHLTGPDSDRP